MSIETTQSECGKEPFFLDWTQFYTQHGLDPLVDLITSSVWEVTGGTKGVEFLNTPETGVFLYDGVLGAAIVAKNTIEINNGAYRDCREIRVSII